MLKVGFSLHWTKVDYRYNAECKLNVKVYSSTTVETVLIDSRDHVFSTNSSQLKAIKLKAGNVCVFSSNWMPIDTMDWFELQSRQTSHILYKRMCVNHLTLLSIQIICINIEFESQGQIPDMSQYVLLNKLVLKSSFFSVNCFIMVNVNAY